MARTLNAPIHAIRRDAFIDVAIGLIQAKGYERMSIQDILDELNASRGAFYHYFESKAALMDAVANRMADQATIRLEPILADPTLTAAQKLNGLFGTLAEFKAERKELVLRIIDVWLSDDNAILRERMRRMVFERQLPWLERIVRQGIAEGTFSTNFPEHLARVIASLIQTMSELASELWVGRQRGTITLEEVKRSFLAYAEAFERIVGVPAGSLNLLDEQTLDFWFG